MKSGALLLHGKKQWSKFKSVPPAMHHCGIPRHRPALSMEAHMISIVFIETMVQNCVVGMLLTRNSPCSKFMTLATLCEYLHVQ